MTFPAASFFTLKTHLEPTILALSGLSTSFHVPAFLSDSSSSSISFSHSLQSGHLFASATDLGSRPSTSAISAVRVYSLRNEPSSTSMVQSASLSPTSSEANSPLTAGLGSGIPHVMMESERRFDTLPSPLMRSRTRRLELMIQFDRRMGCTGASELLFIALSRGWS